MKNTFTSIMAGLIATLLAFLYASGPSARISHAIAHPGIYELSDPSHYAHVFAISDVHGMYDSLVPLLQNAQIIDDQGNWIAGNSFLVVIGDSIDKGPKSIEVLDLWIHLTMTAPTQGGAVLHLLGNHEAEFLADPYSDKSAKTLLTELNAKGLTISDLIDPSTTRGNYLRSMPVAARIGNWLFCHSGYMEQAAYSDFIDLADSVIQTQNYNQPFLIGPSSALEAKEWWRTDQPLRAQYEERLNQNGIVGVVFGHQPEALNVPGADAISSDGRLIKIDNGMAPQAGAHSGSLLLFPEPNQLTSNALPSVLSIPAGTSAQPLLPERPGAPTSLSVDD